VVRTCFVPIIITVFNLVPDSTVSLVQVFGLLQDSSDETAFSYIEAVFIHLRKPLSIRFQKRRNACFHLLTRVFA
jgi:hypothetical protein